MTEKKINHRITIPTSLISLCLFITSLLILYGCNLPAKSKDSHQEDYSNVGDLATPPVDITFNLRLPSAASKEDKYYIEILDVVSGLAHNNKLIELTKSNDQEFKAELTFQSGSVIYYRYLKSEDTIIPEMTINQQPVKYRIYYAANTASLTDQVYSWQGDAPQTKTGNLIGSVIDQATNQPIPDILVSAGGQRTFTDTNGQFVLFGLPEGLHNAVFYAMDGQFRTYQQGALISAQTNTVAEVHMVAMNQVNVTFNVEGPSEAIGVPIYIAGNISQLGNTFSDLPGSMLVKPKLMPSLSAREEGNYSINLQLYSETDLRFKFTLGDGFWNTEQNQSGEFVTRQLIVPAQDVTINLDIDTWLANKFKPITFQVLFPPASSPPGGKYIQFKASTWTEPIPLWPLGDSQYLYILFSPLDDSQPLEYRFCSNEKCEFVLGADSISEEAVVVPTNEPQEISLTIDNWVNWQAFPKNEDIVQAYIPAKPNDYAKIFELTPQMDASWQTEATKGIGNLVNTQANTIIFSPPWFLNPQSPFLQPTIGVSPFSTVLTSLIDSTHAKGLSCGIFPQISSPHQQGTLWENSSNSATWWEVWFNSYHQFIINYAKLAEMTETERLYLGGNAVLPAFSNGVYPNGTDSDIPDESSQWWTALIADIRNEYQGALIWVTGAHQTMDPLPDFISELDGIYISIDSPLAPADASSFDAIATGFTNVIDSLIYEVNRSTGQPITIALAYPSVTNAAQGCLLLSEKCTNDGIFQMDDVAELPIDVHEQALVYNAILPIITSRPWITGISIRGYDPTTISLDGSSSLAGKPALDVIEYWFTGLGP